MAIDPKISNVRKTHIASNIISMQILCHFVKFKRCMWKAFVKLRLYKSKVHQEIQRPWNNEGQSYYRQLGSITALNNAKDLAFAICCLVSDFCHHGALHSISTIAESCSWLQRSSPLQVYNQVNPITIPSSLEGMLPPSFHLLHVIGSNDIVLQVCCLLLNPNF